MNDYMKDAERYRFITDDPQLYRGAFCGMTGSASRTYNY